MNRTWLSAYLSDGKTLVDISAAPSGQLYICPGCGKRMYSTHGEVQYPHFRHNEGEECRYDNYLHNVAVERFFRLFEKCSTERQPLLIDVKQSKLCSPLCSLINLDCSKRYSPAVVVLTERYVRAIKEQNISIGGKDYRPDIMLESNDAQRLWVEIWVTHKTAQEKIRAAKGEVLEIKIDTEEDISLITVEGLLSGNLPAYYYGGRLSDQESCRHPQPLSDKNENNYTILHVNTLPELNVPPRPYWSDRPFWKNSNKVEWIDYDLPSGAVWSSSLMGVMTFDEAQKTFPGLVPSVDQYQELLEYEALRGFGDGSFWTREEADCTSKAIAFHRETAPEKEPILFRGNGFAAAEKSLRLCVRLVKENNK